MVRYIEIVHMHVCTLEMTKFAIQGSAVTTIAATTTRYNVDEARALKQHKEIPDNIKINETDLMGNEEGNQIHSIQTHRYLSLKDSLMMGSSSLKMVMMKRIQATCWPLPLLLLPTSVIHSNATST